MRSPNRFLKGLYGQKKRRL